jgi:hypothetical protein
MSTFHVADSFHLETYIPCSSSSRKIGAHPFKLENNVKGIQVRGNI